MLIRDDETRTPKTNSSYADNRVHLRVDGIVLIEEDIAEEPVLANCIIMLKK
jgi:hypothetical protein